VDAFISGTQPGAECEQKYTGVGLIMKSVVCCRMTLSPELEAKYSTFVKLWVSVANMLI